MGRKKPHVFFFKKKNKQKTEFWYRLSTQFLTYQLSCSDYIKIRGWTYWPVTHLKPAREFDCHVDSATVGEHSGQASFCSCPTMLQWITFLSKISSHCIPIPVWWNLNSWIEWTRIRDFIQMQLRSLGLSINSNVWVLQWNSSENHSIHTVGGLFFLFCFVFF